MRNLGILLTLVFTVTSACSSEKNKIEKSKTSYIEINNYNILIAPDLSNRVDSVLNPKPLNDYEIISSIVDKIYPTILNHNREQNQKDIFRVSFMSPQIVSEYKINTDKLTIDFSKFDTQLERINYLKNRSTRKFENDLNSFKSEYKRILGESVKKNYGTDIWAFLNNIDQSQIKTNIDTVTFEDIFIIEKYRNIIVILTDGYLESGLYGEEACPSGNNCYYLSSQRIKNFRKDFKNSGMNDVVEFYRNSNYGIVPLQNPLLQNLEVLVLELDDRSLDQVGNPTLHPTDMQILNIFWSDWLEKSNVRNYNLKRTAYDKAEIESTLLDFLGIDS